MAVLLQHAERGARLVVEVVHVRLAHELQQVVVALVGLRQQQQVVQLRLHVLAQRLVGGEVHLAAEDGLHALARLLLHRVARVGELHHARHDAVVGDGHRRHVQLGGAAHHVLDVREAVEQRVLGVVVQVYECHRVSAPSVGSRRTGSVVVGYARTSCHAGSGGVLAPSAEALARPCPTALKFRQFLGCHDTSPHAPSVRTNGGFCMDWTISDTHDGQAAQLRAPLQIPQLKNPRQSKKSIDRLPPPLKFFQFRNRACFKNAGRTVRVE